MQAYQYIYKDNQQMGFPNYHLTDRHFSSLDTCKHYLHRDGEAQTMFHIVGRFDPSKLTGKLAEMAAQHEEV